MPLTTRNRKTFDLNDKKDVECFKQFLIKNRWDVTGCPFELEYPWNSVPDMIKDKLVRHYLKIKD